MLARFGHGALACASVLMLLAALTAGCTVKQEPRPQSLTVASPTQLAPPRLVLLVVVDQARGDLFQRFGPLLTGGLGRLAREGVLFTGAHHAHARTLTGPGHASLASGVHPARHGIIGNDWYDRATGARVNCVEDAVHGRSPARLQVSTLGDWLKAKYPAARVYAAGGKDRSAILLGGRQADGAFWYDRLSGSFVSSPYYGTEPAWLAGYNEAAPLDALFGRPWEPLPVARDLTDLGIQDVDEGPYSTTFPRAVGGGRPLPDRSFYAGIYSSPFLDTALAWFARELILREDLGHGPAPDLLALGFSALDTVGHIYGPDSPEYLDTILRLDRELGDLLDLLDRQVGSGRYVVGLSSDHGVLTLPESPLRVGEAGQRFTTTDVNCIQAAQQRLDEHLGPADWLLASGYLNLETIAEHGLQPAQVESAMAAILQECSVVERVWTRTELEADDPPPHPLTPLVRNNHHPERSPDLFVQLKSGVLGWIGRGTTHGSPYPYDTQVPLLVRVPGVGPGRDSRPVRTIDLAPTLAAFMAVPFPSDLDGHDLSSRVLAVRGLAAD